MNHYTLLGVPPLASQSEIYARYKQVALENHPDKGGDTGKFADITLAYSVIGKPKSRAAYDRELQTLNKWKVCPLCMGHGTRQQVVRILNTKAQAPCKKCKGLGI